MDLRAYIRALRRRWLVIAFCVVLGILFGLAKTAAATAVYQGSVTFYVSTPYQSTDTAFASDQFAQDRANSYALVLSSDRLARMIVTAGGLKVDAGTVASEITGSAQLNTVLVTAQVQDTSIDRLKKITQGVARQMPRLVYQLERNRKGPTQVVMRVVSGPSVNPAPISPRPTLDLALGLGIGLIIGLLLAAVREALDNTVRTPEELNEAIDVAVIGTIVFDPDAYRSPALVGAVAAGRRAEDYRQLRTNLEFIDSVEPTHVLAVTSSVAAEGKSSTALNIAVMAAETGANVLLIDADMRRPQIAEFVTVEGAVGLSTVLSGRLKLGEAVRRWAGIDVLPGGVVPPNPAELLDSKAMRELIAAAREKYDLVVVDTPPVLAVTDAAVCSAVVDGMVLVCRYGRTRRLEIETAMRNLRAVNARVVGAVLTMRPRRGVDVVEYGAYEDYKSAVRPGLWRRMTERRQGGWVPGTSPSAAGRKTRSAAQSRRRLDDALTAHGRAPASSSASTTKRNGSKTGKTPAKRTTSRRAPERSHRPRD